MANYPFKINIVTKEGNQFSHYTASLATDADIAVSSSVMVDRINAIPLAAIYTEDEEASSAHASGKSFGLGGGINYLSASVTETNTGSIVFTDVESGDSGVDYYTFYGSKVCSVLGLPEGMPIYSENFKFSDSSTDKINYMSGQVISDSVQIKEGFKLSSQARVKSNLIWDDAFGEGYVQWVSGSTTKQFMGYDPVKDLYNIGTGQVTASSATITNIKGTLTGNVTGNVSGIASSANALNYIGNHSTLADPAGTANQLVFSGSKSTHGNGGDIVLQAGTNELGNALDANVKGGDIILRPGGAAVSEAYSTPDFGTGTTSTGSILLKGNVSTEGDITANGNIIGDGSTAISSMASLGIGSVTATGTIQAEQLTSTDDASIDQELDVADGYLKLGYDAFTASGNYVGITTSQMTGINDYMMISGKYDYNTYLSAKDGSSLLLRGGGNNSANQIQIYDGDTIDIKAATTYISGSLGVGIDPGTTKGLIRATNDVVAFYSSDKRLKDNLVKLGNPLDKIFQLNGYEFDWIPKEGIHENEGHDVGVIAQEVEKILPEIVQTRDNGYKAVKYEKIVPLLIESIKELTQRVEELENGSS